MEYLKPLENYKIQIRLYQVGLVVLFAALLVTIVSLASVHRNTPSVVLDNGELSKFLKSSPLEQTISRLEGFTKNYLSSRFEWSKENFSEKKDRLKNIVTETIYKKLQDNLRQYESLGKIQNAKSYYVFEGFAVSNKDQKIEARVIRVLKIQNAATALPLIVRFSFSETSVSESNPYGLIIGSVEESEYPNAK